MDATPFPEDLLTVGGLVRRIRERLETEFPAVWVRGEISNLRTPASGHTYLTLKDETAQIAAVFFKHRRRYIRFDPEDGMEVLCRGTVTVYDVRGAMQISVDYMEPVGLGALHLAFRQIRERLEREGLFDPVHKKPLPLLPRRIGLVTSPTGAAVRDLLQILHRRFPGLEILIVPVRVQGESAAGEIVEAVETLNRLQSVEVIVLARGGGSLEDLWPFNEEAVARALFASRIPVVSAVGHETDVTIADLAADLRAPTPSAAAELVVPNTLEIEERVAGLKRRLTYRFRDLCARRRGAVEILRRRLSGPERSLGMIRQRIDDVTEHLIAAFRHRLQTLGHRLARQQASLQGRTLLESARRLRERLQRVEREIHRTVAWGLTSRRNRLDRLVSRLNDLSPLNILERGYSIVTRLPGKKIVREAAGLRRGDRLAIRFHRGGAECSVDTIREG